MTSRFLSSCSRVHLLQGRGERADMRLAGVLTDAWASSSLQPTRRGYLTATGACSEDGGGKRSRGTAVRSSQQSTEKWLLSHKCHGGYQIRPACHVVTSSTIKSIFSSSQVSSSHPHHSTVPCIVEQILLEYGTELI